MDLYLVYGKDPGPGLKWRPLGLQMEEGVGEILFSDGPITLFQSEREAETQRTNAAAFHKDSVDDYHIEPIRIPVIQ